MQSANISRSHVLCLCCLWGLLSLAAPGCGEDPKATSAGIENSLQQREKSLQERQAKQVQAKPRR